MPVVLDDIYREFAAWVTDSLRNEGIEDVEVEVTGMSEKGDNYMGDVIFVEAKGKDGKGEGKTVHIVIKKGKENSAMAETWDRISIYLTENLMYDTIFPAFRQFQLEKNIREPFDSVPKCYKTIGNEKVQAILLEDLKKSGYELHDRFVNMNSDHIKFVLYNYAKFHAVSFAMRDQNPTRFKELTKDMKYSFGKMLGTEQTKKWFDLNMKKALKLLEEKDPKIARKFEKKIEKTILDQMLELGETKVEESVIIHGDCWNNNFMFKYENSSKTSPSKVRILDWQLSMVHSPVLDLSYFLYIVSSTEEAARFDEFLHYYHEVLSESIRELGSDPEKLFPFSTLTEHWKRFSCYGVSFLVTGLELLTCDKNDTPDIDDFGKSEDTAGAQAWANIKSKDHELYQQRMLGGLRHFCEF